MPRAGLIQYAERRSAVPYNRCSESKLRSQLIELKVVARAFIILVLGSTLSFIVLFVECILKNIKTTLGWHSLTSNYYKTHVFSLLGESVFKSKLLDVNFKFYSGEKINTFSKLGFLFFVSFPACLHYKLASPLLTVVRLQCKIKTVCLIELGNDG